MATNFDNLKQVAHGKTVEILKNPLTWQTHFSTEIKEELSELKKLRQEDIKWRLKNRTNFRNFLITLLIGQNLIVFFIFTLGMLLNKISGLEAVFNTLVGGTLLETTALILIIVKWLFSEIPYRDSV